MSTYWTLLEIRDKIQRDLDLEGETFINQAELDSYINEAIDEVERQIHTLNEDYFITRTTISLVSGQEEYSFPTDVYAMKIRGIIYRNGTTVYQLQRVKDWRKFEEYELLKAGTSYNALYGYMLVNSTAGSPKILLAPTPLENGAYLKVWYLRNANRLSAETDVMDIPEAVNYVIQYAKVRCYEKEGHPNLQKAIADLEMEKADTIATLSNIFPDTQNELEADMRLYNEMS
jgi:hypothetical protein